VVAGAAFVVELAEAVVVEEGGSIDMAVDEEEADEDAVDEVKDGLTRTGCVAGVDREARKPGCGHGPWMGLVKRS
jgi:pantoate kinase